MVLIISFMTVYTTICSYTIACSYLSVDDRLLLILPVQVLAIVLFCISQHNIINLLVFASVCYQMSTAFNRFRPFHRKPQSLNLRTYIVALLLSMALSLATIPMQSLLLYRVYHMIDILLIVALFIACWVMNAYFKIDQNISLILYLIACSIVCMLQAMSVETFVAFLCPLLLLFDWQSYLFQDR